MTKMNKWVGAALTLLIAAPSTALAASPVTSANFQDLASIDNGLKLKIDDMIAAGVFEGVSADTFGIQQNMTRAQFAKVLDLIYGVNVDNTVKTSSFADVQASDPANGWAIPYIEAAKKAGFIDGMSDTAFAPGDPVTFGQFATALLKGLGKSVDVSGSPWYTDAMKKAVQYQLIPLNASGNAFATRADLVGGAYAVKNGASASPAPASYTLNNDLQVQVLGVHSVQNSSGVELGAAIRVTNTSGSTVRMPDHELRLKGDDGVLYTIPASAANAKGIQGQSSVELTYYRQIDRQKPLNVTDLSLVDVNYDVYPKKETVLVSVPVSDVVWQGAQTVFNNPSQMKKWGQAFTIPTTQSPLVYTPASVTKSFSGNGTTYLIRLLVENPGSQNETVPPFVLEGKDGANVYDGTAVASNVVVQPGEKKYVYYSINADLNTELSSVNVVTSEPFVQADPSGQTKTAAITLGQLNFALPAASSVSNGGTSAGSYTMGSPIAFDANNGFVNPDLQVSLVELHVTGSEDNGYKTAFAKFKLQNTSDQTIPVPTLQTELADKNGASYSGVRQATTAQSVQPGTSAIVSYGFVLPTTEDEDSFTLKLQGVVQSNPSNPTAPAYRSTISAVPVTVQQDDDHNNIHLYPYTLNIKSWILSPLMMGVSSYTYKLNLDMDFTRDPQVVLDNNFSTLKVELIDGLGSSLGAKYFPFVGANRLVSGDQWLTFTGITTDQAESNLTVKVSESINTPNGEMNRVIAVLKP